MSMTISSLPWARSIERGSRTDLIFGDRGRYTARGEREARVGRQIMQRALSGLPAGPSFFFHCSASRFARSFRKCVKQGQAVFVVVDDRLSSLRRSSAFLTSRQSCRSLGSRTASLFICTLTTAPLLMCGNFATSRCVNPAYRNRGFAATPRSAELRQRRLSFSTSS